MNYLLSNIAPFLLKVKRKTGLRYKKTAGLYGLAEKKDETAKPDPGRRLPDGQRLTLLRSVSAIPRRRL